MSEGLEALKSIININYYNALEPITKEVYENNLNIIEQELNEYERLKEDIKKCNCWKEHKTLEIIKDKKVNVLIFCGSETLEEYNKHSLTWHHLTKEEYDLLKEVLL